MFSFQAPLSHGKWNFGLQSCEIAGMADIIRPLERMFDACQIIRSRLSSSTLQHKDADFSIVNSVTT